MIRLATLDGQLIEPKEDVKPPLKVEQTMEPPKGPEFRLDDAFAFGGLKFSQARIGNAMHNNAGDLTAMMNFCVYSGKMGGIEKRRLESAILALPEFQAFSNGVREIVDAAICEKLARGESGCTAGRWGALTDRKDHFNAELSQAKSRGHHAMATMSINIGGEAARIRPKALKALSKSINENPDYQDLESELRSVIEAKLSLTECGLAFAK